MSRDVQGRYSNQRWIFGKETCVPPVPQANVLVDQHVHSERFTRQLRLSVLRSYSCQTLMPPCSCKACPSSTNKVVSAFWVLQWASELVKAWLVVGFGVLESWKLPKSPSQGTCLDGLEIQTQTETYDINDIKRPITKPSLTRIHEVTHVFCNSMCDLDPVDLKVTSMLPRACQVWSARVIRVRASGPQGVFWLWQGCTGRNSKWSFAENVKSFALAWFRGACFESWKRLEKYSYLST